MLVYTSKGKRNFGEDPVTMKTRPVWEFWTLLDGNITFDLESGLKEQNNTPTMIVFPPNGPFGCRGRGISERAVFDFNAVPSELEEMLPARGYYRAQLTKNDGSRIRTLASLAKQTIERPTQLASLQQQALLTELSLMALCEVRPAPLRGQKKAQARIDQAVAWYATNMQEKPGLNDIAKAVHVSVSHLRRLFQEATGEGPKASFSRLRMERVDALLTQSDLDMDSIAERVGLADATALSRAVKKHFGMPPGHLRKQRRRQSQHGY